LDLEDDNIEIEFEVDPECVEPLCSYDSGSRVVSIYGSSNTEEVFPYTWNFEVTLKDKWFSETGNSN
jgi:hypothetical protein